LQVVQGKKTSRRLTLPEEQTQKYPFEKKPNEKPDFRKATSCGRAPEKSCSDKNKKINQRGGGEALESPTRERESPKIGGEKKGTKATLARRGKTNA